MIRICAAPTGLPASDRFVNTFVLINWFLRISAQLKKEGQNGPKRVDRSTSRLGEKV